MNHCDVKTVLFCEEKENWSYITGHTSWVWSLWSNIYQSGYIYQSDLHIIYNCSSWIQSIVEPEFCTSNSVLKNGLGLVRQVCRNDLPRVAIMEQFNSVPKPAPQISRAMNPEAPAVPRLKESNERIMKWANQELGHSSAGKADCHIRLGR